MQLSICEPLAGQNTALRVPPLNIPTFPPSHVLPFALRTLRTLRSLRLNSGLRTFLCALASWRLIPSSSVRRLASGLVQVSSLRSFLCVLCALAVNSCYMVPAKHLILNAARLWLELQISKNNGCQSCFSASGVFQEWELCNAARRRASASRGK